MIRISPYVLWPRKESLMKTQTRILDNKLYYTRRIELHRKGKKSRTVRITPIVICPSGSEISVLITVRRVHYSKMSKVPTTLCFKKTLWIFFTWSLFQDSHQLKRSSRYIYIYIYIYKEWFSMLSLNKYRCFNMGLIRNCSMLYNQLIKASLKVECFADMKIIIYEILYFNC